MFAVIDEDGALLIDGRPAQLGTIEHLLRDCGYARVRLDRAYPMTGWVSDVGLALPEFRRNPVGSAVLVTLGANQQPYGGPVIVTGYEHAQPGEEEWGGPEELPELGRDAVIRLHRWVEIALTGRAPGRADDWADGDAELWAAETRRFCDDVRGGPIPPIGLRRG